MHNLSAVEIHKKFTEGELSALEITTHFLQRIEKHNKDLGAFITILRDRAIDKAKKLDERKARGEKTGLLAAIPIAVKDNIHVLGTLTTCGSKFLKNFKAPFSATVTNLLEKEDAIIVGKTNLDEFAMGSSNENSAFFPARNPWNLKYAPGGSSGGSAAAVAARLVPLALGSDTGGSIRQPASLTGIVGFKPTYGRVSRFGLVAFASSLDQIGPLAKSTEDTALIMDVIGRHCKLDSTSLPLKPEPFFAETSRTKDLKGTKVGIPWSFLQELSGKPKDIFDKAVQELKNLGAEIVSVDLDLLKYSIAVYYILATAEASTNLARFDGIKYGIRSEKAETLGDVYDMSRDEGFGPEVKRRIMLGTFVLSAGYQDAYYKKAQKVRELFIEQFSKAFEKCDVIALPVSPWGAFEIGSIKDPLKMYLEDIYTIAANLVGAPAISIPCGFVQSDKPYGLQFIGPQKEDLRVLKAARAFEKNTAFHLAAPEFAK